MASGQFSSGSAEIYNRNMAIPTGWTLFTGSSMHGGKADWITMGNPLSKMPSLKSTSHEEVLFCPLCLSLTLITCRVQALEMDVLHDHKDIETPKPCQHLTR